MLLFKVVYIHDGISLSYKKEQNNAIFFWHYRLLDGPRDGYTEWSKSDIERQISYDIIYMWNKRGYKWTYLQNRSRVTNVKNKLMVTTGIVEEG